MKTHDLSTNLKAFREALGMTQGEIAPYFGVKQGAYSAWETGTREPDLATICEMAKFFKTTTDVLLGIKSCSTETTVSSRGALCARLASLRETAQAVSTGADTLLRAIDDLEDSL